MIKDVYIWTNGMVMVFDEKGEQVTEKQGRFAEKAQEISEGITQETNMYFGAWRGPTIEIPDKDSFDRLWKKGDFVE